MVPDHKTRLDYPTQADEVVEKVEPLIDRVERLERALLEASALIQNHGDAIARVGSRLSRVEKHIGLPSTDVDHG